MSGPSANDLAPFLAKLESVAALSPQAGEALRSLPRKLRTLRRHEFIVRENEIPRDCCVLLSGLAIRHKSSGNGLRQIFSIHMRGDAVDLPNSMLGRADHNLQMLSHGNVAFIPIGAIRDLTAAHPEVGQAMWRETLIDGAIFREWTLNVGRRDARSRMAHMLCEFAVRLEAAGSASRCSTSSP